MTDRELLEFAAKAAGIVIKEWDYGEPVVDPTDGNYNFNWNPLTDDGDALRLAVKLKLEIEFSSNFVNVGTSHCGREWHMARESGDDLYAATRRAIVRAAAEIGRSIT